MKKPLIIVTGGCGYIGSHTICELIEAGYDVASMDNLSRSSEKVLSFVEKITGQRVYNYNIDLCNAGEVEQVFNQMEGAAGLIHFAAFKSVPESVASPEIYYHNNIASLVNVLQACAKQTIRNVVFSSSCSVYGDIATLPVSESTPLSAPKSPYAATKVMGETIVKDMAAAHGLRAMCLRYFNPVGAHQSGLLGEMPLHAPDNLVPVITQTAIGKRSFMRVFGGNLPTRDGSCIRDYVHVSDIAQAHVLALQNLQQQSIWFDIINLGTGCGVSVLEAIETFEKVSGVKLNYQIDAPRGGDVIEIYSNVEKASGTLGWKPKRNLEDMMASAWKWEQQLAVLQNEPSL